MNNKTNDWEERLEKDKTWKWYFVDGPTEMDNTMWQELDNALRRFIQTLLKEKNEEFVKELGGLRERGMFGINSVWEGIADLIKKHFPPPQEGIKKSKGEKNK